MQGFIEKLIGMLEEEKVEAQKYRSEKLKENDLIECNITHGKISTLQNTIKMVIQLAEEYKAGREKTISKLLNGEWVDTGDVINYLGVNFKLGLKIFDFSREAEWNPPPLNGQKITTKFRLKKNNDFCEWKDSNVGIFHIKTSCNNSIETNYGYEFCPYCGKKINVVEQEEQNE